MVGDNYKKEENYNRKANGLNYSPYIEVGTSLILITPDFYVWGVWQPQVNSLQGPKQMSWISFQNNHHMVSAIAHSIITKYGNT